MAKKNPYVFTIGFDETDPSHVRAAGILNGTKKKAQLIAAAVLSYMDENTPVKTSDFTMEAIQPLLEKLIRIEVERAMEDQKSVKVSTEKTLQKVQNLSAEEDEVPIDESLSRNIVDAMNAFRKV